MAWPVVALAAELVLLGALSATAGLSDVGWLVGTGVAVAAIYLLASALTRHRIARLGAANRVTLGRTVLSAAVAALVSDHLTGHPAHPVLLTTMAAVSLTLDVVDGPVARRTGQATALGARFDMEADAILMTVLSVNLASLYGWWILGIGALRYAFVAAAIPLPWLTAPLPHRPTRRLVAAITSLALVVVSSELFPGPVAATLLATCLAGLVGSFGRDIVWLAAHRPATGAAQGCPLD
jgi:phosphatidylglycerophosphate synthase